MLAISSLIHFGRLVYLFIKCHGGRKWWTYNQTAFTMAQRSHWVGPCDTVHLVGSFWAPSQAYPHLLLPFSRFPPLPLPGAKGQVEDTEALGNGRTTQWQEPGSLTGSAECSVAVQKGQLET